MTTWPRRVRGAIGMGLVWAVAWALFGLAIGVASLLTPGLPWNVLFDVFDAPLPTLAVPGFIGGALFSVVLGVAGRRRRFHELSMARFVAWGAAGGLLVGLVPAVLVALGLATPADGALGLFRVTAFITLPVVLLGALSAALTLLIARRGERGTSEFDHLAGAADRRGLRDGIDERADAQRARTRERVRR